MTFGVLLSKKPPILIRHVLFVIFVNLTIVYPAMGVEASDTPSTDSVTTDMSSSHIEPSVQKKWYENLHPGITRSEIRNIAGAPSSSGVQTDRYNQEQGYIELKYEKDALMDCTYYNPGEGTLSQSLYYTFGSPFNADAGHNPYRKYIKEKKIAILPINAGRRVRTAFYPGIFYELEDGSYLNVVPIISLMGGMGYFKDKTAQVSLFTSDGTQHILYNAIDNWKNLRPPHLTDEQLNKRIKNLMNGPVIGEPMDSILGGGDSGMGSGILYLIFYLDDSLAIVNPAPDAKKGAIINSIDFWKPGLRRYTLDEWRAARLKNR